MVNQPTVPRQRRAGDRSAAPPATVLSMGMGVDSVAIAARWLREPDSRDFDLADLILLTAMTGNEYAATAELMRRHLLPELAAARVRYVQVARAGQSSKDGIVVLDDTRTPTRMHMRGPWSLSDELEATGTVPQIVSGRRLCSYRAKGEVLDAWIAAELHHQPYVHCIGFAAEETKRVARDSSYTTLSRTARYPLVEWGWDRRACEGYLLRIYGTRWPRSCCGYCPFQIGDLGGLVARWRREPALATQALRLEYAALALNPRSALFGGRTAHDLAAAHGLHEALARQEAYLAAASWGLYRVRRIYHPRKGDPTAKGPGWRSVACEGTGDRDTIRAQVLALPGAVVDEHGIARQWRRHATAPYPAGEEMIVAAPDHVGDKQRPGFEAAWARLRYQQPTLFGHHLAGSTL